MVWGSVGLAVLGRGVGSWAVQRGLRGRPKGQLGQVVCRPLMAFGFCFAAGLGLTGFGLRSGSRVRARLGLRASVRVSAGVG